MNEFKLLNAETRITKDRIVPRVPQQAKERILWSPYGPYWLTAVIYPLFSNGPWDRRRRHLGCHATQAAKISALVFPLAVLLIIAVGNICRRTCSRHHHIWSVALSLHACVARAPCHWQPGTKVLWHGAMCLPL